MLSPLARLRQVEGPLQRKGGQGVGAGAVVGNTRAVWLNAVHGLENRPAPIGMLGRQSGPFARDRRHPRVLEPDGMSKKNTRKDGSTPADRAPLKRLMIWARRAASHQVLASIPFAPPLRHHRAKAPGGTHEQR
jgi:hypothetical protein